MMSMIRNKYLTLIGAGLLFAAVSCTDGYEPEPVELVSIDFVFSKTDSLGTNAVKFMNNIYSTLQNGHNRVGSDYLDAASDDAISINVSDPDVYKLAMGRYTASTRVESDMRWKEYYTGIRKANIMINHIDVVPFMLTYVNSKGEKKPLNFTMKAEARFLRAYFYFELVKRYGGVPLMGDEVHILGDDMEIPRNTFEQCVKYIVDELDEIKDDLRTNPMPDFEQYAHTPTRETCLALKSRVLLYAASPLFNERPIEKGNELIGYASYDSERWNEAAKAAKAFIDEYGPDGNGAYGLTKDNGQDFRDVFLGFYNKSNNPEVIFYRPGGENKSIETNNGPLGFSANSLGKGRTLPTQNLVDAFPMKDGMFAGKGSKYQFNQANPYENRDPRLDYTVLHHGSSWLNNTLDISTGGVNNPSNSAEYSKTSYYMCKFMGKFTGESEYSNKIHLWVMFRYAEMLLNYAEAENEYLSAPSKDVYDAIIALRARAGIEPGDKSLYGLKEDMTQKEMREVIQNERRIEMAFEEQRYWDIRRWRIAEDIFKEPLKGLEIRVRGNSTIFNEVNVLSTTFDVKRYFYPIPYTEVVKNDNMIQNPKW
ncbi:RagB/SusD family nutrient uptake outer membrane protein [Bacteroides sp.]|uniref:RagB/SusD family nutrient uptake outer membrane protein n=1 Tax=Bacteroides sp. TaxID=29523 RepID=UPI00262F60D9|nr:RagB/SusD family nutrient uptake outer membrane protein [Bacteroides sp.]MDD3036611.1 RagB/SusD family nutrient uptake outer membrane protein [Bacteroides sp.]